MQAVDSCVFCRIAGGQIPADLVLDEEHALAFLDIGPLAPGHLLLVPRQHFATLDEIPPDVGRALGCLLPRLVGVVRQVAGATGVNVLQNNGRSAGQEVLHVHFHLIPRRAGDGLGYRWNPGKYAAGQAEAIRAQYRQHLAAG